MGNGLRIVVALSVLCLTAGCATSNPPAAALPTERPQAGDAPGPAATRVSGKASSTPVCPPARGDGTVAPAVSIYSITFAVNGLEQVVRDDDTLPILPGDRVQVTEAIICAGPFSGNGGEACVDIAPVDGNGQEIASEHSGTHTVRVTPGFVTLTWPDHTWTIGEDWRQFSVVLNHWPPVGTEDPGCGDGRCERDDRITVRLR